MLVVSRRFAFRSWKNLQLAWESKLIAKAVSKAAELGSSFAQPDGQKASNEERNLGIIGNKPFWLVLTTEGIWDTLIALAKI
ncbi:hypothetical protein [Phaeodactylibacter luteus]|uniref:Uncharacterized protein n=1 Tax=Phaeodactylibacter luteus TaxID=1564516 RepID=A0A5C6RLP5_9BACT|nr:hypothetical protein [Phaeodactylibacter luteus]TXB62550.1 hypothetical protein FRY97_13715 [Phaeodactylibacter luteus]